ncbi:MAG TPA: 8-amino-7-oxononanoate synthase [Flavobacterium sp.]
MKKLRTPLTFTIHKSAAALPELWDTLADGNVFLSQAYLEVLETSAPENMQCFFISVSNQGRLVAVAVSQFLDLRHVRSFGERDNCLKTRIRDFVFRRFSSRVLILGNNMLTGQNALRIAADIDTIPVFEALHDALDDISAGLKADGMAPHLFIWKDFYDDASVAEETFSRYFKFRTQPNMMFDISSEWNSESDYIAALLKKYRDQSKRARKKMLGIVSRELCLSEISLLANRIYELYYTVAKNAPFNTFYLQQGHFLKLKELLGANFVLNGYFLDNEMIGFSTLIKNGCDIDTYFLGYEENCQREKMLYLNMLYDMIGYSVGNRFRRIVFARTALEIKSSVGAIPVEMFGFIKHKNPLLNRYMPRLFRFFEPETKWQQRHPFRHQEPQLSSGGEESGYQAR